MEITKIKWNDKNLIPAIIQDYETLNVLMLGYMNEEAINLSIQNGQVTFLADLRIGFGLKVKHQAINC